MPQSALTGNVIAMLQDVGFVVSDRIAIQPKGFSLTTRRGEDLLLLKIFGNIDAFNGATGSEMRHLGLYLDATPLTVGLRTRNEGLKPNVVYFRHSVPVPGPDTAMDLFVEEVPPLIYAAPDELYMGFDGDVLAEERQERGRSLGRFATEFGVSRHTVLKYESGMNASIEIAIHLEKLFDHPFSNPVGVLTGAEDVRGAKPTPDGPDVDPDDEHVLSVPTRAGFTVHPTARTSFKAVSGDTRRGKGTNVLTRHSLFTQSAEKRAQTVSSFGEVARTYSVYFVEEQQKRESIDGTSIVSCEELAAIDDSDKIRDPIRERTRDPVES